MSLGTMFGFGTGEILGNYELPLIFPMAMNEGDFIRNDLETIYAKILTDVLERTQGLEPDQAAAMWDNCLANENSKGIVSLLSTAMYERTDLYLVYDKALKFARLANQAERAKISEDYKKQAYSSVGVYVSFKDFKKTSILKLYSVFEYLTICSLHKSMNLSKAMLIKISELRSSVSLTDSKKAEAQAKQIATQLGEGKDVLIDAKDIIESPIPDISSIEKAFSFINEKKSFYLGLPKSYITGEQTSGMGSTGEQDTKAIERGLKNYYQSIIKPLLTSLFGVELTYKSQDFRQITQGLTALQTFDLISDTHISSENKTKIINQLFDFDNEAGQDL